MIEFFKSQKFHLANGHAFIAQRNNTRTLRARRVVEEKKPVYVIIVWPELLCYTDLQKNDL